MRGFTEVLDLEFLLDEKLEEEKIIGSYKEGVTESDSDSN